MDELTERQRAILDFVRGRIEAEGLPPTWAEIAAAFGFRQTRAAQKHLQAIAAKGYLTLLPGKARGIRLPDSSRGLRSSHNEVLSRGNAPLSLPVLGRVAAGVPIGADAGGDAGVERVLGFDPALFSPRPDYLLRVRGDSMREEGILDGDLVAVQRRADARNGQVVVARLDEELTIKRLELARGRVRLLPRNPDYAPIEVRPGQDFAIEGLYCGLVRA